jgi:hypothetical protein
MKKLNTEKIWHDVLESIKVSVSPANFTTWFKQTHLSSIKGERGRFGCRNRLRIIFCQKHNRNQILRFVTGKFIKELGGKL